jgi:uncharacterized SAM-binding protein YcdF (DUF218 family)
VTTALPRQPPRRPGRALLRLLKIAVVLALLVAGAFLHFVAELPREGPEPGVTTDALVVLTGGTARVGMGLELLADGRASRMFISGVNPATSKSALASVAGHADLLDCCVDLGFEAADTVGNALETAQWVEDYGIKSLGVVTGAYHMPRALLELSEALRGRVALVPYPVFPDSVKLDRWWAWPGTASLLFSEFGKYAVALIRARLGDLASRLLAEFD